ncbi:MAG TPA: galactokinase [Tepidisphaeraceae bacterium]|nr:galactokinase [Tepidisphaeraceae bacterium]
MNPAPGKLLEQFHQTFGGEPGKGHHRMHIIRAPGRVNLIGEHTDYNDGFVFPMAIEPDVRLVCRAREDGVVRLASTVFPGQIVEFSVQKKIQAGEPKWANYSRGVAGEMEAAGIPLSGMDCLLTNTLPVGGGLSSSAAIEIGTALALLTVAGQEMDRSRMALLSQKAEHEYAGAPVGIMDQTIVASGKAGHAMLLDCRDLSKRFVPIDPRDLRVVIANTMVKHELTGGEYAQRRKQCEEGVAYFQKHNPSVKALRDVTLSQLESAKGKLSDVVYRRCRHVITENARTTEAADLLVAQSYEKVGELMGQSHASLRDDYEVSCPELDFMVEQAVKVKGVYGARMTGGGFGGCIVALTQPRSVEPLIEHLQRTYLAKYNIKPTVFATTATDGASVLE